MKQNEGKKEEEYDEMIRVFFCICTLASSCTLSWLPSRLNRFYYLRLLCARSYLLLDITVLQQDKENDLKSYETSIRLLAASKSIAHINNSCTQKWRNYPQHAYAQSLRSLFIIWIPFFFCDLRSALSMLMSGSEYTFDFDSILYYNIHFTASNNCISLEYFHLLAPLNTLYVHTYILHHRCVQCAEKAYKNCTAAILVPQTTNHRMHAHPFQPGIHSQECAVCVLLVFYGTVQSIN